MMTRRRFAYVFWRFTKWAWTNRKAAAFYELTLIRDGREVADYMSMATRALGGLGARGVSTTVEFIQVGPPPAADKPRDLDRMWSELQRGEEPS